MASTPAKPAKKYSPPTFNNISKSASDLFKKKFDDKKDFKNVVKTTYKTASGLVLTTGGDFDSKNNLTGNLKAKYAQDSWGEVTGELSTAGPAKLELKLKKLVQGLTLTLTEDTAASYAKAPARFSSATAKVGAEYTYDWVTATASYETSVFKENALTGGVVIGVEGLAVGGEVKINPNPAEKKDENWKKYFEDYNVGAQYDGEDFTAAAKTTEQCDKLTLQYIHKVNADLQVGGQFSTKLATGDDLGAGLVGQIEVDKKTTVKLRGETRKGGAEKVAAVAVEHRLENPKLAFGLASSYNLEGFSLPKPQQFGISVHFGDFEADK